MPRRFEKFSQALRQSIFFSLMLKPIICDPLQQKVP